MISEEEILKKLSDYRDAILKIKSERDEARKDYTTLKDKTRQTIKHLVEDNIEVKEAEIEKLTKRAAGFEELLKNKDYLISKLQTDFGISISDDELIQRLKSELEEQTLAYNSLLAQFNTLKTQLEQDKEEFKDPLKKELQEIGDILNTTK